MRGLHHDRGERPARACQLGEHVWNGPGIRKIRLNGVGICAAAGGLGARDGCDVVACLEKSLDERGADIGPGAKDECYMGRRSHSRSWICVCVIYFLFGEWKLVFVYRTEWCDGMRLSTMVQGMGCIMYADCGLDKPILNIFNLDFVSII